MLFSGSCSFPSFASFVYVSSADLWLCPGTKAAGGVLGSEPDIHLLWINCPTRSHELVVMAPEVSWEWGRPLNSPGEDSFGFSHSGGFGFCWYSMEKSEDEYVFSNSDLSWRLWGHRLFTVWSLFSKKQLVSTHSRVIWYIPVPFWCMQLSFCQISFPCTYWMGLFMPVCIHSETRP